MSKPKTSAPDTEADLSLKNKLEQVAHMVADRLLHPPPVVGSDGLEKPAPPLPIEDVMDGLKILTSYYATIKKIPPEKDTKSKFSVVAGGKPDF